MRRSSPLLTLFLLAGFCTIFAFHLQSERGEITVEPDIGIAGHFGTWTVTYRVGAEGIAQGGGIRVQLPDSWHAGDRNSANRLQATDPAADHYISARASRSARVRATVESETDALLVKQPRAGLDGRSERYVFVARAEVVEGRLRAGDTLSIVYGDTTQGSRGMRAAIISTPPEPVLVAVDSQGSGNFQLHPNRPTITSRSGPPAELWVYGPSSLVSNRAAELHLAVLDANWNPIDSFTGEARFHIIQGEAQLPESVQLNLERGWGTVRFTPTREGILRIAASTLGRILEARSNPMKVESREPRWKTYWGDLHSHTRHSWDGVGTNSFDYARYVSGLDFYAVTDHSRVPAGEFTQGLGPHVWDEYTGETDKHYDPGQFVTLHAYEASFRAPYGHHNVFFRGRPGPLLAPARVTLPQLWGQLTAGDAVTIPHHTGKFPRPVSWEHHDPNFRRNFEIYSGHGLSETFMPDHPLAFEQSDFTAPSSSAPGPQFAQDAWIRGLIMSTMAASDDHRAQPGKPHWGLAAIRASGLTRGEVFDALHGRRTYGTTGARILLDFSINGQSMGGETAVRSFPHLQIEVHGTDVVDRVEVLRYSKSDGTFKIIHFIRPDALDLVWSGVDRTFREDSIYYVRLWQKREIHNRIVMAWSSPIWVKSAAPVER